MTKNEPGHVCQMFPDITNVSVSGLALRGLVFVTGASDTSDNRSPCSHERPRSIPEVVLSLFHVTPYTSFI